MKKSLLIASLLALSANATTKPPVTPTPTTGNQTQTVGITNINAAAQIITWQMSGIPNEAMHRALLDPDVVAFLANRGLEIARSAQAGYGQF